MDIGRAAVVVAGLLGLALLTGPSASAKANCAATLVDVSSTQLWVDLQGDGPLTVVFESGNGNDSTVWSSVAPRVRTLVYDRAGLGRSASLPSGPFSVDSEISRLRHILRFCGVDGPVIMVGASYGGAISLILSSKTRQVRGVVLVDAVVPDVATADWAHSFREAARPDYPEVRRQAPEMAAAVIPVVEAMPATAERLRRARIPVGLPIINVVADKAAVPGRDAKADAAWVAGHDAFAKREGARETVLAKGSGHKVMVDAPDVVVDAITRLIARLTPH